MEHTSDPLRVFDERAAAYAAKYMAVDLYRAALDLFMASLADEHAHVLDIACGPGNIAHYLLLQRPGLRITGIDGAPRMVELARRNNPVAEFRTMDAREIGSLTTTYDGGVCGFCLPYLSPGEASQLVRDVAGLLRPHGAFYLSTIEGDPASSGPRRSTDGKDMVHMTFHRAEQLVELLGQSGFSIVDVARVVERAADGTETPAVVIVSRT